MKRKILSGIIVMLAMIGIIFISGCVQKECETDADCLTKTCFTVKCTDNKCVYSSITNCCGNEICEIGETYSECVADCPNCDDKNKCTIDEYDYHKQKCVNTPILDVVCCGNTICEIGETYETCTRDCPNCDDENECTKDSYDYHQQKCINEPIIPCCGNSICDKDAEIGETYSNCARDCPNCDDGNECTKDSYDYHQQKCINEPITPCCGNSICDKDAEIYSTCPTDCPNCDDNNRLTGDSFNYKTQKCEYIEYYYFEDFNEGTSWIPNPEKGPEPDPRWVIVYPEDETNGMLTKVDEVDSAFSGFGKRSWTDYTLRLKVKIEEGAVEISVRAMFGEEGAYAVSVSQNHLMLDKDVKPRIKFETKEYPFGNEFHEVKIEVKGNNIKVYVDDTLEIDYTDNDNPILTGHMALYTNRKNYFDDIIVEAPR